MQTSVHSSRQFVILDRDGTIIEERNYLSNPEYVELLPNTLTGLRKLQDLGLGLVVVTNQSGVGRGLFTSEQIDQVNGRMTELLARGGVRLDGIYSCPHTPESACECRKPSPGLAVRASCDFGFRLESAFVVGDKRCDIELGHNMGAYTVLVRTGYGALHAHNQFVGLGRAPHSIAADLDETADVIRAIIHIDRGPPRPGTLVQESRASCAGDDSRKVTAPVCGSAGLIEQFGTSQPNV